MVGRSRVTKTIRFGCLVLNSHHDKEEDWHEGGQLNDDGNTSVCVYGC